ncbi:alpha-2-HS-glycoprotein [Erpetoichthys calabaricus]|nr:alpha-2-HS-glycoprotein [Erpetoichthys calabaricus]
MHLHALLLLVALVGSREGAVMQNIFSFPPCDSPQVEEAAFAAVKHINSHHYHGYKYVLNRIEKVKMVDKFPHGETYILEMDLLETKCHILNPTPAEACPVRSRAETKVEGDCDVMLSHAAGQFSVIAYKCKSTPDSAEDVMKLYPGQPMLLPLNDTNALQSVTHSLRKFNQVSNETAVFHLMEIGRMSSQVVASLTGPTYFSEFAIVETNCTDDVLDQSNCVPLSESTARHGFCSSSVSSVGLANEELIVNCDIYPAQGPPIFNVPAAPLDPALSAVPLGPLEPAGPVAPPGPDGNAASLLPAIPVVPAAPAVHHHHHHPHSNVGTGTGVHGFKHHGLGHAFDPAASPFISSSEEMIAKPMVKRSVVAPLPVEPLIICPGRIRHF